MSRSELLILFKQHEPTLKNYLNRYLDDPQLSADITQESFLRLAEQMPRNTIVNIEAYLYRTAKNIMLDHFRSKKRRNTEAMEQAQFDEMSSSSVSAETTLINQQQLGQIELAVASLPLRTREIFYLSRIDGLTQPEIAKQLNVSLSTVEKHLALSLKVILQKLTDE